MAGVVSNLLRRRPDLTTADFRVPSQTTTSAHPHSVLRGGMDGAISNPVAQARSQERPPQTLPAVVHTWLYDPSRRTASRVLPVRVNWHGLAIPPAMAEVAQGVFGMLPCFEALTRRSVQAGGRSIDAVGAVSVITDLGGGVMNSQTELDAMSGWIRHNGMAVDRMIAEFPDLIQGYAAEVVVEMTEDETFLLVRERAGDGQGDPRRARGGPVDASYIYRWPGGRSLYLANPNAAQALAGLLGATNALEPPAAGADTDDPEDAFRL